ncbi:MULTISPECIES: hypothetical protein [Clostridium]|uniref:Phage protein n=1 Tax=Clostridium frigoriphilum TaxID=443253 RepID=A0ABU7UI53_9CLOT|nr:hypothetical protein [Clostridium sp. DSM 17811]MBU3098392.1 hypothetical protein [Clostridium sp. DSM 17811]
MKIYAVLNGNNICTGISQLSGEVIQADMIEISSPDMSYMWKKYEGGVWSAETFEPVTTAPINDFDQLKLDNEQLKANSVDTNQMLSDFMDYVTPLLPQE